MAKAKKHFTKNFAGGEKKEILLNDSSLGRARLEKLFVASHVVLAQIMLRAVSFLKRLEVSNVTEAIAIFEIDAPHFH
jgi:hypothetical protein